MDKGQTDNPIPKDDINVPTVIADLEMLTIDNNCSTSTETKRVLRKRKSLLVEAPSRRCTSYVSMKPRKRCFLEMDTWEKEVKEYYLDKKIKKKPNNLETIYEESENTNDDSTIHMSSKRFKRMLLFSGEPTTTKLNKRRAKIRRIFGSKVKYNCISMQTLADKLNAIKESSSNIDNELE